MKIKTLSIKNMRLIGDAPLTINFDTHKNVTLIVGDNGAGKTTILDALSYIISPFISQFPGQSINVIAESDVHIEEFGHQASYLELKAEFTEDLNPDLPNIDRFKTASVLRTRKGYDSKSPESEIKEIKSYASSLEQSIKTGSIQISLPILAYYGTDRGHIVGPERRRYSSKLYERWDSYTSSLESATNFKRFFVWYDLMEDDERREREIRQDFSYHSPVLTVVRTALTQFLGTKYCNPRILTKPLRFVMDEKIGDDTRELRIEQMSSGYKISTAMIADLAARMAEANPDSSNPLEEQGIVLIDEIDLHLHACWQKIIISQLTTIFPNIQFIVTTHSPIVVLGANDNNVQLIRLKDNEAKDMTNSDLSNYDVSMILLSEAFSLDSVYSTTIEKEQIRRKELLLKKNLSNDERDELNKLNRKLISLPNDIKDDNQQMIENYLFSLAEKEGLI